jgi:hypothetical protein
MFSALMRVDIGRWRSSVQAEEMEPLFELCKDCGKGLAWFPFGRGF